MTPNGNGKTLKPGDILRVTKNAPLLGVTDEFLEKPLPEQIKYWRELASSYHKAANDIQKERNTLNVILFSKEEQLIGMQRDLDNTRMMVTSQLKASNEKMQEILEENRTLQAQITELEKAEA